MCGCERAENSSEVKERGRLIEDLAFLFDVIDEDRSGPRHAGRVRAFSKRVAVPAVFRTGGGPLSETGGHRAIAATVKRSHGARPSPASDAALRAATIVAATVAARRRRGRGRHRCKGGGRPRAPVKLMLAGRFPLTATGSSKQMRS